MSRTVLVTGASGYIGSHCAAHLAQLGHDVRYGSRYPQAKHSTQHWVCYGDGSDERAMKAAVVNAQVVVHCAGQASAQRSAAAEKAAWAANVDFTRSLAQHSASAGVAHFILMSSALVVAGSRDGDGIVSHTSPPAPLTAYARTKLGAELCLAETATMTALKSTVLRPPMVYGPDARGNFARLSSLVRKGFPLPLAGAVAAKSFIFIDNLVSAITAAIANPPANHKESFLVSDNETTSTADLIAEIARQTGRKSRLFQIPTPLIQTACSLTGFKEEFDKLFRPFVIDNSAFHNRSGWSPPISFRDAIQKSVQRPHYVGR